MRWPGRTRVMLFGWRWCIEKGGVEFFACDWAITFRLPQQRNRPESLAGADQAMGVSAGDSSP